MTQAKIKSHERCRDRYNTLRHSVVSQFLKCLSKAFAVGIKINDFTNHKTLKQCYLANGTRQEKYLRQYTVQNLAEVEALYANS